ncbi:MAG: YueI family protein [Bacillus sp. (in: firmicutes)]
MKKTVDDYIEQGIYGKKEINPEERRMYLGTFRERVVIALTTAQVRKNHVYTQVEEEMKAHSKATLYLNGSVEYSSISKYVKAAQKRKVTYTIVTNKEHTSKLGLVLAYDYAIDREEIFVKDEQESITPIKLAKEKSNAFSFLKKWIK